MVSINKFSLAEATSDSTGKTCMSLICGFLMIFTGCVMGICVAFGHDTTVATLTAVFITGGSTLLGVRRFTKDEELKITKIEPSKDNVK